MIRDKNICVSFPTARHLKWAAKALDIRTVDELAERWLQERLLTEFPNIEELDFEAERQRQATEKDIITKLKNAH